MTSEPTQQRTTSPISERRGCRTATTNEVRTMFMRGLPAIAATVALVAAPATASARESYKIGFEKDCPELTCTGTLIKRSGAPIPGSVVATTLTPLWFETDMLGYSARETFSRGDSAFTMNLVGTVDYSAEPDRDRGPRQRRQRHMARSPAQRRARARIRRTGHRHHLPRGPRDHAP